MAVYGYIRVSTDKQDSESQKIGIIELAKKRGYPAIDRWISDNGVSGTVACEKRNLGKLMKKLKTGDVLLASEISRLARNLFLLFEILKYLSENQIELYTVKDNYSLDGSIASTVLAFAFGMAAQIERDMISKRTKEGLEKRRRDGVVMGRPIGAKSSRKKLTGRENKIREYLSSGMSYVAMAKRLKVDRNTLVAFLKEEGMYEKRLPLCREKQPTDLLTQTNDDLLDIYRETYTLKGLAEQLNISLHSLMSVIKARGLYDELIKAERGQRRAVKSSRRLEMEKML